MQWLQEVSVVSHANFRLHAPTHQNFNIDYQIHIQSEANVHEAPGTPSQHKQTRLMQSTTSLTEFSDLRKVNVVRKHCRCSHLKSTYVNIGSWNIRDLGKYTVRTLILQSSQPKN